MDHDKTTNLPSTLGETSFAASPDIGVHGLHIHAPEGKKFDPVAYYPSPNQGPTDKELNAAIIPQNEPVIHPLLMVDDQHVLPRDYVVHRRSQECLCCHKVHRWVDVYARNEVPPQHNMGKVVQNLVPVKGFRYNLPVRSVDFVSKPVPACHECLGTEQFTELMNRLPDPRSTDEWQRTIKRKAAQALETANKAKSAAAKEKKKPLDLKSALDLF